ncbi:MAG: class I SAM-dependent RNA methyltransferase [Clostridiales bacterium]|nr:class I SAM-dependent RNA methyltransferase [Clostridiales bacterium]
MKKGEIIEGTAVSVAFPNKGTVQTDDGERVLVKGVIEGQRVSARIGKARHGKLEGRLFEVLEKSPLETAEPCQHYRDCGGCSYQTVPYETQLKLKEEQVKKLLAGALGTKDFPFLGISPSPNEAGYRNKMEFTFGDMKEGGPLTLGMHRRGSFYDIVTVDRCRIVDGDFRAILSATLSYFSEREIPYYHRMRHLGYLRHLLVRKGAKTGEILVDLVTTGQTGELGDGQNERRSFSETHSENNSGKPEEALLMGWACALRSLDLSGKLVGILHTRNDSVADAVKDEGTEVLFGQDFFFEELLGLRFKITPFSFFQTNSLGAEVLYGTAREFIGDSLAPGGSVVFDLYSGTGTIAQMLAPAARKVIGVEIVPEAVMAARENAKLNELSNCEFLEGDVLKVLDEIDERPDFIVLDPPRDGVHPKALGKIIRYGVPRMVYISCKPTSLARDLSALTEGGYTVKAVKCVDMFPSTVHLETVCLLAR